jgi:hypothetical protein
VSVALWISSGGYAFLLGQWAIASCAVVSEVVLLDACADAAGPCIAGASDLVSAAGQEMVGAVRLLEVSSPRSSRSDRSAKPGCVSERPRTRRREASTMMAVSAT